MKLRSGFVSNSSSSSFIVYGIQTTIEKAIKNGIIKNENVIADYALGCMTKEVEDIIKRQCFPDLYDIVFEIYSSHEHYHNWKIFIGVEPDNYSSLSYKGTLTKSQLDMVLKKFDKTFGNTLGFEEPKLVMEIRKY